MVEDLKKCEDSAKLNRVANETINVMNSEDMNIYTDGSAQDKDS